MSPLSPERDTETLRPKQTICTQTEGIGRGCGDSESRGAEEVFRLEGAGQCERDGAKQTRLDLILI